MTVLPKELLLIAPAVTKASAQENPLVSLKETLEKIFQRPEYGIRDHTLTLRIESSFLDIRIDGPGRFRTFVNSNPNGGSLSSFGEGKPCDTEGLLRELVEFEAVQRGT